MFVDVLVTENIEMRFNSRELSSFKLCDIVDGGDNINVDQTTQLEEISVMVDYSSCRHLFYWTRAKSR